MKPKKLFEDMEKAPYLEHWIRINKLLELVKLVEFKGLKDKKIYRYQFELYMAFFMFCYHLKDWIINSKAVKANVVHEFINKSYGLGICRNLCLGIKHFDVVNPSPPEVANFGPGSRIPIVREYNYFGKDHTTKVLVDGKNYNALELAENCVSEWNRFIKKHKLMGYGLTFRYK
ncbi:hypothetical protein B6D29_00145 [Microgenomates bacterium UTCPR1]|nr:MAG: hypothetical protein B6D29_00145 [Microgenomates bacterium UTCPR1]